MANTNTAKYKERKFLIECIKLYRNLPALWQVNCKLYHNRDKKKKAYDLLLAKYNEMFPQATKEDLKKRINSLRTNYRKELKKCVNSMKSGAKTNSKYVPKLWYFDDIHFLRDHELPSDSESFMESHNNATADEDEDSDEKYEIRVSKNDSQDSTLNKSSTTTSKFATKTANKDKQLINIPCERLNEIKDQYYHWGMACAADLQKMEITQQLYAKKAIAEILMEGQLGLLHRHSVKINENTNFNFSVQLGSSSSSQYSSCVPAPSCSNHTPLSSLNTSSTPPEPSYEKPET